MRKKILFLDDDDVRHYYWSKRYGPHHDCYYAHDMQEYLDLLHREHFDIVSLDHDLNENQYRSKLNSLELNGCHAAEILTWLPQKPNHVHIHSWNRLGAMRMASIVGKACIPCTVNRFHTNVYLREAEERYHLGYKDEMYMRWMNGR